MQLVLSDNLCSSWYAPVLVWLYKASYRLLLFIYLLSDSFYARLTQIFLHWARAEGSSNFLIGVNLPLLGVDRWAVPPAPPRQAVVTKGQGQQLVFVMQPI